MSDANLSAIQAISALLSTTIAVIALFVAYRAERRGHDRFTRELALTEQVAASQVKPFVSVYSQNYSDLKSLIMINRGIGPAAITSIVFSKNGKSSKNASEMFQFPEPFDWENKRSMPNGKYFLGPGEKIILAKITEEHLVSKGAGAEFCKSIMESWHDQKTGIELKMGYEDALGNEQPQYVDILR